MSRVTIEDRPCTSNNRFGKPCQRVALAGEEFCAVHHPDYAPHHRRMAREGGQKQLNRSGPLDITGLDLTTLDGLREFLARALDRLAALDFDSKVASAAAVLASQQRTILQDSEFERRLGVLEQTAEEMQDRESSWR